MQSLCSIGSHAVETGYFFPVGSRVSRGKVMKAVTYAVYTVEAYT